MNKVLLCLMFCLVASGCSSKSSSKPTSKVRIVKMGDPSSLYKGAELDKDLIGKNAFKDGDIVWLRTSYYFMPEEKSKGGNRNLEKENQASTNPTDDEEEDTSFMVILDEAKEEIKFVSEKKTFHFFKDGSAKFYWYRALDSTESLVHVSFSPSQEHFNLLTVDEKKIVSYLVFYRKPLAPFKIEKNEKFKFGIGPGVFARWKKPIPLELCGPQSDVIAGFARRGVDAWNKALPESNQIVLSKATTYRPFSDLNQHCVYVIDDLLSESSAGYIVPAITYTRYNHNELEIIDSDILLFAREFEKYGQGQSIGAITLNQRLQYTMTHEIGHLLGLDHQFDKKTPSIMSYAFKNTYLRDYDREAIQLLYGITKLPDAASGAAVAAGAEGAAGPVRSTVATPEAPAVDAED